MDVAGADADAHSYGPHCRLAPVVEPSPDDALLDKIPPPPINAQFFYHSLIPIDDPLSTATIAATSDSKSTKGVLRPFAHADNNALERAWLSLSSADDRSNHYAASRNRSPNPPLGPKNSRKLDEIVDGLIQKHREKHAHDARPQFPPEPPQESLASTTLPVCCPELLIDASNKLREAFCGASRKKQRSLDQEHIIAKVMSAMEDRPSSAAVEARAARAISTPSQRADNFVISALSTSARGRASSLASNASESRQDLTETRAKRLPAASAPYLEKPASRPNPIPNMEPIAPNRPLAVDDGVSGNPFLRVEETDNKESPEVPVPGHEVTGENDSSHAGKPSVQPAVDGKQLLAKNETRVIEVPVGVSRLHMVSLPVLQMKPIYWSPVNDISIVSRATWFYRDTMVPVEPAVANQLEAGYRELRPYSQTWQDEIRCAVEVGALGEEKVSHPLWHQHAVSKDGGLGASGPLISSDPFCAARCFCGEAAAEGTLEPVYTAERAESSDVSASPRSYASYHVIYKDARAAFLLKASLKPSAYYGRRPVSKLTKDLTVGIPVVRGFDREIWDELHEKKKRTSRMKDRQELASASSLHGDATPEGCPGCQAEKERRRITDLVLVAHGIGQKFAERVESFHFTHAVTAFRRSVNIELGSDTVKSVLRKGHNGIMVLPVNWRHTLSFEDGGPMKVEDGADSVPEAFGLRDIEPKTIPAVRSLISDVMFDIPFYMSQHKPEMIKALVAEANRVYRLWCRNNPEFTQNGRVHLIAHSLGSVMAIDVLSKQPSVPPPLDLSTSFPETRFFEFDTTNLFLLGSPAGFFLLLERGSLVPRRGRQKPGSEPSDTVSEDVVGDAGAFGCMAVDNIYNILAKEDPIAYLLNGTIDPLYAASLRTAHVPSTATSWFKSMGGAVRGFVGPAASSELPVPALARPPTNRLPSQLELEIHDFTREEVAERKAFLLNDNGQVDYYLRSGTGPLELQYVNMLSAHTSYWTNNDLVRLLCMEIGREPGRSNTLPVMRAVKMTRRDRLRK